jgi:hypothetical protein
MRAQRLAAVAGVAVALATPASAQIISTSLPRAVSGTERKTFSVHLMVTPLARWDYKEAYLDGGSFVDPVTLDSFAYETKGAISGTPYSSFMAAGEVAFAVGDSHWAITAGGWYNKVGSHDYDLSAYSTGALGIGNVVLFGVGGPLTAKWKLDMSLYEGHVGVFYKSIGVQFGYVRTEPRAVLDLSDVQWVSVAGSGTTPAQTPPSPQFTALTATNDWSVHVVYRTSRPRWGASVGAGPYVLKGIAEGSPLRFGSDQTVLSLFATGSLKLIGPLGLDASVWYLGNTGRYLDYKNGLESTSPVCVLAGLDCSSLLQSTPLQMPSGISKSRLTLGIGLSF